MFGMAHGDYIKFILWLLLICSCSSSCFGSDYDVQCLKTVQQSVIDPGGILKYSWSFDHAVGDFVCGFSGVECWSSGENKVLALSLNSFGLEGQFPQGLQHCTSLISLDLSNNSFSGPIPSDIAWQLPYLTFLDLSYNSFSGQIPVDISNMVYLNTLRLQHNRLSGQIPSEFSVLFRLTLFNVADNILPGSIPSALQNFSASNFAGNQKLCGAPLDECPRSKRKRRVKPVRLPRINDESFIGAAAGFVVWFVVAFYFPRFFVCSRRLRLYLFLG